MLYLLECRARSLLCESWTGELRARVETGIGAAGDDPLVDVICVCVCVNAVGVPFLPKVELESEDVNGLVNDEVEGVGLCFVELVRLGMASRDLEGRVTGGEA